MTPALPGSGRPLRILLADDTRTVTALMKIYLMNLRCEFVEAADGAEALGLARQKRPDLIISDVSMPNMDGFELCSALRADPDLADVPVVLLTAFGDEAAREAGARVGAQAFLTKPVSVAALREAVAAVLGTKGAP